MNRVATFLILLAITTGAALAQQPAPTVADILARARAAQGGAAWDGVRALRTTGKLSTGGLDGRFESLEDVTTGAWVDRFDLGPFRGAQGFDGIVAWSQDPSGMARTDGSEEAATAAVSEAYRRSRAFWFPGRRSADIAVAGERVEDGRRFQVLAVTPEKGRAFDLWFDAATGLPDRFVQKEGSDLSTTLLSDYRELAGGPPGLKLPFATRSTNGNSKYDTVALAESVEINPAAPATAFALPPPPPVDSGFDGGVRTATVPFEVINGHVLLRVRLNGQGPFRLLFDTGGLNVVGPRLASALGLRSEGTVEGRGTGEGSEGVALAKVRRVDIGPAFMKDQTFYVFNLGDLERVEGAAIDGLVGYEVCRRFIVRFDYERGEIMLADPAGWKYAGLAEPVPFVFNEHVPEVDGSIDGIPGKFDIDTGSRSSLDLFGPFVDKHQLAARYPVSPERITGWGVGGPARGFVARGRELRLGPVAVAAPVVELSKAKRGSFASDFVAGNVGYGVLRRFNVTFDYPGQKIYFEQNRHAGERDTYERAGMWVNLAAGAGEPAFEVVDVVPGGPAGQAGIRAGDRIIRVDGRYSSRVGLPAFRTMLKDGRPGTRIDLRVASPSGDRNAVIVLRDLV